LGADAIVRNDAELRSLVLDLLSGLGALHGAGIVHRDVRMANVIKCHDRWVLIDVDLAGRAGEHVWFDSTWLPSRVRSREDGFLPIHDLWMVGKLKASSCVASSPACAFGKRLRESEYGTAAEAIANIWEQEPNDTNKKSKHM
jgi:serine/threonine protein kinase